MSQNPKFEEIPRTMQRPGQGQAKITSRGNSHAMSFASKPVPKKQYALRYKPKPPTVDSLSPKTWDEYISWSEHKRMESRFGR